MLEGAVSNVCEFFPMVMLPSLPPGIPENHLLYYISDFPLGFLHACIGVGFLAGYGSSWRVLAVLF